MKETQWSNKNKEAKVKKHFFFLLILLIARRAAGVGLFTSASDYNMCVAVQNRLSMCVPYDTRVLKKIHFRIKTKIMKKYNGRVNSQSSAAQNEIQNDFSCACNGILLAF